eukprot:5153337-Pleurochrysis_carterae.AAC.2
MVIKSDQQAPANGIHGRAADGTHCSFHLSTGVSPVFALHLQHPISLPGLGYPLLIEVTETGSEFVDTLATRLRQAWLLVRNLSESIQLNALARSDAHHWCRFKPSIMDSVGRIQVEYCVLLRHGSLEDVALMKKHGFPPLRSFRVLEIIPVSKIQKPAHEYS